MKNWPLLITNFQDNCHQLLRYLSELDLTTLYNNCFEGPLPEYLSLLKNLSKVNFSHNKFSGNISPLAGSNSLTVDMTNNSFSGPIPSELVVSKNLTHLRLSNNFFTGKTPSEFGQLEDLRCLDLLFKNLTGDLAPSLAGLKTLAVFFLYLINFRGKFPHGLWRNGRSWWVRSFIQQLHWNSSSRTWKLSKITQTFSQLQQIIRCHTTRIRKSHKFKCLEIFNETIFLSPFHQLFKNTRSSMSWGSLRII